MHITVLVCQAMWHAHIAGCPGISVNQPEPDHSIFLLSQLEVDSAVPIEHVVTDPFFHTMHSW